MNQIQLQCKVERLAGGCEFSSINILPSEMAQLDGQSAKVDGETIRFRLWKGERLYVNQRGWTHGYFSLVELDLSWGSPLVAVLHGNYPSPVVAQAVRQLLGIDEYRLVTA